MWDSLRRDDHPVLRYYDRGPHPLRADRTDHENGSALVRDPRTSSGRFALPSGEVFGLMFAANGPSAVSG